MSDTSLLREPVDRRPKRVDDTNGMVKKYVALRVQKSDRAGNLVRGFVMGLAEFGSFGTRLYDLAGYPYESESAALYGDWKVVGGDLWKAVGDVATEHPEKPDNRPNDQD